MGRMFLMQNQTYKGFLYEPFQMSLNLRVLRVFLLSLGVIENMQKIMQRILQCLWVLKQIQLQLSFLPFLYF